MMTLDLGSPIFRPSLSQIPRGNWLWRSISTVWQPNPSWSKAIAQMAMDACQHAKPLASGDAEDDPCSVSQWGDRPPRDFGGEMAGRVGKQRVSACKTWDIHSQSIEHDWTFFARFCQFNMNSRTYYLPKHHRSYFFQQENPSGSAAELKWWWINWYPICRYLWCAKPTIITLW